MKNFLLFNQSFGTVGSPNQTGETLTRENRIGLMSYLRRTLMLLFAVLVMSVANIGMAWADTLTETHNGSSAGVLNYTSISTTSGTITYHSNSSAINVGSNTSASFTVSSFDGSNISSIVFTQNSSYPINTLTTSDGEIVKSENTYTFTPSSLKTSYSFTLTAQEKKNCRVTTVAVTLKSNDGEYFSKNFSYSGSSAPYTINATKSNASTDISISANNNSSLISSSALQLGNGKQLTIASSGHNIKKIVFVCVAQGTMSNLSANTGTYSSNVWTAGADTKTVTFTSSGSNANIVLIRVDLASGGGCTSITPTWSTDYSSTTLNVGATSSTPVVGKDGSSGAVTFSSSDTYIATVNSSGVVTGVGAGTATITATVAANGDYCSGTVTKEFTIKAGVTYDANSATGGSEPTDANTYAYNANITVADNTGSLYKTGFVFNGWNTRSDGTGTHYEAGATMKMPSKSTGVTLYAEWVGYATSWEWWNSGQSNDGTTFTYITSKNYICSFASSASTAVASWDMSGGEYYRGIKIKTKDHSIAFWVQTGKRVSITFGTRPTKPTFTVGGVDKSSDVGASENADSITVTYTTTGDTKFYIENETATKTAFTVKSVKIEDDAPSCTAPNHVDISGNWDYFGGETISLTATPYSSAGTGSPITSGITGYQWQKLISSTWTDVEDGTDEGTTISGATTANLQIAGCTGEHSGKYRCTISTGATCSTSSATATDGTEGFQVKVFTLECYTGGTTVYHFTRIGETQTGSTTITLAASTGYQFKFHVDGTYYGNSGTINEDVSNWVCTSGAGNLTINSGLGGTFTITMDYSDGGSSSTVGEPEISVTYPRKTIYLNAGGSDLWDKDNAKFGIYYFRKESETLYGHAWTDIMPAYACGSGIYVTEIPQWNGVKINAVRLNPSATNDNKSDWWDNYKYNQTNDCPVSSNDYITITGWNEPDYTYTTYDAPEYTISFDGNGETSGSMTDVEDIECDASVTLAANAFVKTGYSFNCWHADKVVQVGGSTIPAGGDIAGGATIQEINGNITLTAQWTVKTTAITLDKNNSDVSGSTSGSVTATYGSSTLTSLSHATRTGYTQNGYQTSEKVVIIKADGTLNSSKDGYTSGTTWVNESSSLTLYARWTATSYTLSYDLDGGSVTPANPTSYTIESSAITLNNPTKTGYTFAGWTGTGLAEATTTVTIAAGSTGNRSYTATWTAIVPSSVSLNKTSTTITVGGTETLTATISPAVVADNTITWTSSDETVATVTSAGVVTGVKAGTATITATTVNGKTATCEVTVAAAVTYTVTYEYNGATGGDDTPSATGASVTLPEPTKTGYELEGWYTTAGAKVDDGGETYSPTADITLYARWTETCSGGGGSGSTTVFKFTVNDSGDDLNVVRNGGTLSLTTSNAFSALTGGTVTAVNINTNSGGPDKMVGKDNSERHIRFTSTSSYLTIAMSNDLAEGDTIKFTGNGSAQIQITTTTTPSATISTSTNKYIIPKNGTLIGVSTIYVWPASTSTKIKTFSITRAGSSSACHKVLYHGNGAESGYIYDPNVYDDGDDPEVLGNTTGTNGVAFVKDGYTLQGWATSAGGSVAYSAGDEIENIEDDVNLYAVWEEEGSGYTVSIAANPAGYGTVSSSSVTSVASGTTLSASTNTLSVGATDVTASATSASAEYTYAFSNWTKSDGTDLPLTVTSDLSVYANFTRTANNYTLTWNANGGSDGACTGSCTSGSTAYNTTLVAPTDPTLSNYTFDGWKTNNDGTGSAAAATMPAANTTYYAAWKQTATLTTGAQGSGDNQTPYIYINGATLNGFSAHSASGYTLQGYYTAGSGGTKVLNADGTFASANVDGYITSSKWSRTGAAPTLYAQWVAAEDCHTLKYAWKVTGNFCDDKSTSVTASDTVRFPANASNLYFTESGTGNTVAKGSSYNIGKTKDNYFLLTAKSGYQIKSICFYGKVEDTSVNYTTDGSTWSSLSSTNTSGDDYYSFSSINASAFGIKLTAASPGGIWIRNMVIEVCASGDVTYNVTYDDNGSTGGTAPTDNTNYSYGGTVTVKGNTGSLAKTNYSFVGWTTNDDGTGSSYVADNTFSITANTTLYAKWTQSVTLDKNGGSTDGSATAVWNATGLTGITHAKPASGYKLLGYYSASSDGTKVLNSDGSFAATNVTDYITDGKWSRTSATTLYAEYESAGALTWNLIVNSDTTNLSTSTKTSAFTEISTSNMTNAALTGLTYSKGKKSSLTGKIEVLSSEDAAKYASVSFQVASGYKFIPSSAKVIIQPVETSNSDVKIILSDGTRTITQTKDNLAKGKKDTVTLTNSDADKYMMGTVTLKIYVYGASSETYRLGTPITIEGEIEEACGTMPSYTSMSYTTTTFAPNVDASGSPITIVGGENIDTYQWKYNKVNDRTSGTNCGTGTSLTPLTNAEAATDGTRYYWCEMTNEACDITIKSPAVAITVAAAKSDATVTWTDPASTPNYGGGGYTIKATVETGWDGNAADLVITAPAGIRIYNIESGTADSKKYVQASFDVTTAFDRETYSTTIPFTVSAAATATYNAISNDHNVSYSACAGAGEGSSYNILVRKAYTKGGPGNNYYYWDNTDGWISSPNPASSISSAKASSTMAMEFDSVSNTNAEAVYVRTYHDNIKKIRIYADFRANNMTVSNVYKHNDFYTANSKYEVDYSVVYNGDEENSDLGDAAQGYVDITLSDVMMSANDILLVKFNTSRVRPLGAVITESSAGSLNTYLQWSGSLADDATVNKKTTDAYFTYSASKITENTNTLGAITYSSSNTSAATVDATGKVALVAAGTTTIKATLAASGCYKKAEISYTLNVAEVACEIAAGTLTLTSGTETKCEDDEVTLTLTGFESGATLQWKDGDTNINDGGNYTIETDGTTSTLTTDQEGTYSVMVTSGCSVRSNRITISNKSTEVGAKRIVKNWYIKNGRLTPDIELWTLQNGAHLSSVAWDPANTTGLTASDFYESDGKVYLKGKEPSANESGADINYTLTLTVEDDCGSTTAMSASGQLIYLHHQQNTDKHVLAFVVNGTDKGGFTEGITAAQTTSVPLYNEIAENFDVLATNIRSTDDEQALKEYYSQFDILCVTDYPNTGDKGVNKKSYVDALGALVDIRPILTMEAWVSKLANWKAKGISGTPESPTTRQYTMLLQCKDHEIFAGTKLTKVGEGDETMYRISMVCDTLEDYKTLDATYGDGAHADKSGYEYASKPALQGFTFDATMADDGLLPLGLIDDGSGNDLQVGIERQTEMEARLMVLGINSYAMERLTDDGQTVVVNALKYLMKKNSEDIADCSNTFVGGDDEEDVSTRYDWNVDSHWSGNAVPDRTQKVRIVAPCVIKADEKFHVTGVVIAPIGKYNHGANTANGSLTIAAGGALIVDGKVEAATAPLYTETRATAPADLTIGSTETNGNGTLIFDNEDGSTQAIVEYYSKATTNEASSWSWQYMAVPFNDNSSAYRNYYDSYLYRWAEDCSGWEEVPNRGEVYPWVGYTITQVGAKTYVMDGTLVETGEMEFTVPEGKNLVLGNSWTAPIQVKQFTDDDFANMSKNVYLFNTGYDKDGEGSFSGTRYEGGTYVTIPIHSSPYTGDSLISSLQAFIVYAKADEGGGTFTLDYDRHVRPARSTDKVNAGQMHAPQRGGAIDDKPAVLKVWASGSRYDDRLVVLEREDFSTGLDEGWDGNKRVAGNSSPLIFAVTDNGREAVSAIPTMEGTLIGFWAGEDNEYTLHFEYNEEDELYLLDLDNNTYTPVNSNSTYVFTVPDKKAHNRFILTRNAPDPVATGVGETQVNEKPEAKAIKFLKDEKVFIFVNGKLYDATGKIVK